MNHSTTSLPITLIVLMITLGGCAQLQVSNDSIDSNQLLIANLPSYLPGEFFVYDSGLAMIVTGSSKDTINWKYSNGAVSSGYQNFLVPQLSWEGDSSKGKRVTEASQNLLWPLTTGNSAQFGITQTSTDKANGFTKETKRKWECSVSGTERISVPAGNFDTYRVVCNRYTIDSNNWRGRHTYYFSPDIRHYVRLDKDYANRSSKREQIVRYGFNSNYLDEKDQGEAKKILFQALEKEEQGVSQNWSSSSGHVSVMLIPYQRYSNSIGQQCREYKSVFNVGGRVSHHNRKACRAADGTWQRTSNQAN
ncbi:MAG: hypothetical protein HKP41_16170 [Desulfobacterales bacterium]|nr:hypothetical protein [Desulfobacterales bacterium]